MDYFGNVRSRVFSKLSNLSFPYRDINYKKVKQIHADVPKGFFLTVSSYKDHGTQYHKLFCISSYRPPLLKINFSAILDLLHLPNEQDCDKQVLEIREKITS